MKKVISSSCLKNISLPIEIYNEIKRNLSILDEEYGKDRSIASLGGYIFLVEVECDIKIFKERIAREILPEYTDEIICSGGVKYTSSLFLLSSDYSVVVIAEEKFSKILLDEWDGEV